MNTNDRKAALNNEELDAFEKIQQEAADTPVSSYTHVFSNPFTYEGRTFERLTFDFSKLSGNDDLAIENELQALGKPVIVAEMSGDYQIRLAARACTEKLGVDVFMSMPLRDFHRIRNRARSFLLSAGI